MTDAINVEVVFATPKAQRLIELAVPAGTTVEHVLRDADVASQFKDDDLSQLATGIWGRVCDRSTVLTDGDRVEIYRELEIDPRSARRQLALAGRTMRETKVSAKAPDPAKSR